MHRHGKPRFPGQLVFDSFDDVMRHEWFAVVLANVTGRVETGLASEIAGELAAIAVLDDDDMLAPRKDAGDLSGVEWNNPLDVKVIGHNSFLASELLDGFENHAVRRTPSNQSDRSVFGTDEFWRSNVVDRSLHLAPAFFD